MKRERRRRRRRRGRFFTPPFSFSPFSFSLPLASQHPIIPPAQAFFLLFPPMFVPLSHSDEAAAAAVAAGLEAAEDEAGTDAALEEPLLLPLLFLSSAEAAAPPLATCTPTHPTAPPTASSVSTICSSCQSTAREGSTTSTVRLKKVCALTAGIVILLAPSPIVSPSTSRKAVSATWKAYSGRLGASWKR